MIPRNLLDLSPVARLRRRCNLAVYLYYFVWGLAAAIMLAGVAALWGKVFSPTVTANLHWLALFIPAAGLAAYIIARREFIDDEKILAIADDRFHADGLLVTAAEVELGPWQDWLKRKTDEDSARLNLPRWNFGFIFARLTPCLLFLFIISLVPQRISDSGGFTDLGNHVTGELEKTLEALDEAGLLDPERRDRFAEQIEQLRQDTEQHFGASDWEAADAIREMMKMEAQKKSEDLRSAAEMTRQAMDILNDDVGRAGEEFDEDAQTRRMEEAADLLERAMAALGEKRSLKDSEMKEGELGDGDEDGDSQDRQIARRQQQLRETAEELAGRLDDMMTRAEDNMSQSEEDGSPRQGQPGGPESDQFAQDDHESEESGDPGAGGISKGPGEAPMTWGDEGPRAELFEQMKLPPGFIVNPEGMVIGMGAVEPEDDPIQGAHGASREFEEEPGLPGADRRLSPRHRSVIQRYFEGNN